MKKLIAILVITALLLSLAPTVVYAAAVEGSAKGGNTAPTVDGVWLVETGDDTAVTAMAPLTEYRVKATIGDINTIDDIETIEFHVYHTSNGAQSQASKWDADECAIFIWTKAGSVWSMENNGGAAVTSWLLGTCIAPTDFAPTSDDWYLGFTVGELAQADAAQEWHAWVRTVDDGNRTAEGSTATGATMGAYNEITLSAGTIVFGDAALGIEPGATGYITSPDTDITTQVASNDIYALWVKSDATWDGGGAPAKTITLSGTTVEPPLGAGEFSLFIDDVTLGDPGEPKTKQAVTSGNAIITGHTLDPRTETIDNGDEGTTPLPLYMGLSLSATGVDEVTYTGTITFTVSN